MYDSSQPPKVAALEQVDPGDRKFSRIDFNIVANYVTPFTFMNMTVVQQTNVVQEAMVEQGGPVELCCCQADASESLAKAGSIEIHHHGSEGEEAWPEHHKRMTALGKHTEMPANVTYDALRTEALGEEPHTKGILFEGTSSERNGLIVRLRLDISEDDQLVAITWYHNKGDGVGYLIESGQTLELMRVDKPSWDSHPWRYWSYSA